MGNGSAVHLSSQIGFKEPESSSTITVNISTSRITRREMYFLSYNWRVIVEGACYKYLTLKLNNPSDFRYESGLSWYCTILFDYLKATYQVNLLHLNSLSSLSHSFPLFIRLAAFHSSCFPCLPTTILKVLCVCVFLS